MAAPSWDGAASDSATSTSDTSIVVTAPAGSGGLLMAFGNCVNSRTISPPAGWTQQATLNDTGGYRCYLWTRADDAAANYTFTVSGTFNECSVAVVRIGGADGSSFVTATAGSGSTSDADRQTVEAPGLTTAANDSLVVWFYGSAGGQNVPSAPAGVTEQLDITGQAGSAVGAHLWAGTKAVASAGAEAGKTVTKSGFGHWAAITVAISPAAGGASNAPRAMHHYRQLRAA